MLTESLNPETELEKNIKPESQKEETVKFTPPVITKNKNKNKQDEYKTVKFTPPVIAKDENKKTKSIEGQKNKVYKVVEAMPQYQGGTEAMFAYLSENIKYPEKAQTEKIQGRVIVTFVVSKTGEIKDARIIRGLFPECDVEALRVVNAMPKWIPGKQNNKEVDVQYTLPINFSLGK